MSDESAVRLQRGDTVGVASTAFAARPALVRSGVRRLRQLGYDVRLGRHALAADGYLAGGDEQRLDDLVELLSDPAVKAIWFARGGYGTARLLEGLPPRLLGARDRLFVGYSDLSALFVPALRRSGTRCLYGPMVAELGDPAQYHEPSLRRLLAGRPSEMRFRRGQVLVEGRRRGRLVGGTLSVLTHLWGTRWAPDTRDAVLLLEDTGEMTYCIDRMLTQWRQCGGLDRLAGVLLGAFSIPPRRRFPADRDPLEVFGEFFGALGVPVVRDLPLGHVAGKWTAPLGGMAEIDTKARRVRLVP